MAQPQIDPDVLSELIHTNPECISSAAMENEAYIQRAHYDRQIETMESYLADLVAKRQEWNAKWETASAKTKAAIQKVIDEAMS